MAIRRDQFEISDKFSVVGNESGARPFENTCSREITLLISFAVQPGQRCAETEEKAVFFYLLYFVSALNVFVHVIFVNQLDLADRIARNAFLVFTSSVNFAYKATTMYQHHGQNLLMKSSVCVFFSLVFKNMRSWKPNSTCFFTLFDKIWPKIVKSLVH